MRRTPLATLLLGVIALAGALTQARSHIDETPAAPASHHAATRHGEHRGARGLGPAEAAALYRNDQRAGLAACADQFPGGRPLPLQVVPADMAPLGLCSDAFAVIYSPRSRTPLVVAERLNRARLQDAVGEERTDAFYPDPRLPRKQRAELADYRGSGYDRGHNSPAADQPDPNAMAQSFALSNMVPQDQTNNRKIWNKLEQDVRKFVQRAGGDVYVFTGPLFDEPVATIGDNRVWVPARLFKLVYDASSRRAWAYVLDNTATAVIRRPMDYASFVSATGLALLPGIDITGSIAP